MKVCLVSHSSDMAGAERMLLRMVDGLRTRGVEVFVFLPGDGRLKNELEIRRAPYACFPYRWWAGHGLDLWGRLRAVARLHVLPRVVSQLRRWGVDVVMTNSSVVPIGALAAYVLRRPHVWYLHEFGRADHGLTFTLGFRRTCKIIAGLSRLVVVNSRAAEGHFSRYIPQERIRLIYYGVGSAADNCSRCDSAADRRLPRLVLVGTYSPGKGQLVAIKALKRLIDQKVLADLVLVGAAPSGAYLRELKKAVADCRLGEFVSFVGYKDDPAPIVAEADMVLMCSRSEAFGLVTVEAMKLGKPVIGARGGATPELVRDGFNGFLFTVDNTSDLAAKILRLLENPNLAKQMGENGRRWAEQAFYIDRYIDQVLGILRDAATRDQGPPCAFSS